MNQRNPHPPAFAGVLPALMLTTLAGCGPAPKNPETVDLEALPLREVEVAAQFGAIDHPVHAFSRIGGLAVGPDCYVHGSQPQHREVMVFTPEGDLVRRIGREGDGPGEFRSPGTVGWHGDTLWVIDAVSQRITWFDDGEVDG